MRYKCNTIILIGNDYYRLRYKDAGVWYSDDRGLWRANKVKKDWRGWWYCCDDDDYLITDVLEVVAKESGWYLRRTDL